MQWEIKSLSSEVAHKINQMKSIFLLFLATSLLSPLGSRSKELNFDALSEYTSNKSEINYFSNIIPSDWSFDAIIKLAKSRDCDFITRKSDLVSSRESFSRHEAALIIRKCLKDVISISEEEKRLLDEFSLELNSIKKIHNTNNE